MTKFHINKQGIPAPCKASERPCPLGGSESHFKTQQEAQTYIDNKNEEEYGLINQPTKRQLRVGEVDKEKLNKKDFCIVTTRFEQYAMGVTGQRRSQKVIVEASDKGFANREDAVNRTKEMGLKNKNVSGGGDDTYGDVGAKVVTVKVVTVGHALKNFDNYDFRTV